MNYIQVAEELIGGYTERKKTMRQHDCAPFQEGNQDSHDVRFLGYIYCD